MLRSFIAWILLIEAKAWSFSGPIALRPRRMSSSATYSISCYAGDNHAADCLSIPVSPFSGSSSRQIKFTAKEVQDLEELRRQLDFTATTTQLPAVVILPSWRQHVVQYDSLCAALGVLGFRATVTSISDGLWAYSLKRLGVRQVRSASKQRALGIQVMYAMHPMFERLEDVFQAAVSSAGGRPLVVLASDDSAWVVRAFLNHRETVLAQTYPILAAVFIGSHQYSYAGSVALDAYPATSDTPLADTEGNDGAASPPATARPVQCYSLNLSTKSLVQQGEPGAAAAAEAQIACVSHDDVEECVIGPGDTSPHSGLPWLSTADMLRVWLPKVLGQSIA